MAFGTGSCLGLALLLMVPVEAATAAAATGRASAAALLRPARSRWRPRPPRRRGPAWAWAAWPACRRSSATPLGAALLAALLAYGGLLASVAGRRARRAGRAALADRARYGALADALDDVVLQLDRAGAAARVGCAAQRLFGLQPAELAGRGLFERLQVADRPVFLKLVADAADGRPGTATLRLRTGRTLPSERGDFDEPVFASVDLSLRRPRPARGRRRAARARSPPWG